MGQKKLFLQSNPEPKSTPISIVGVEEFEFLRNENRNDNFSIADSENDLFRSHSESQIF